MINAYSQRFMQPYSGQIQVVESKLARAITMDGEIWEVHFLANSKNQPSPGSSSTQKYKKVAYIKSSNLQEMVSQKQSEIDERIIELAEFLLKARLPFPANDTFEYWLLDAKDSSPLALLFSCSSEEQIQHFPAHPEWIALPAAQMPIKKTEEEQKNGYPPVNYRLEKLIAERAGSRPKAQWYARSNSDFIDFPSLLIKEDWSNEEENDLCQRYIHRKASRLLMLHGLSKQDRKRLEISAKAQPLEVAKFFPLYPDVADEKIMNTIRVEARLRQSSGEEMYHL
jgi:hypothetical protein